jgi:hypothetical protein
MSGKLQFVAALLCPQRRFQAERALVTMPVEYLPSLPPEDGTTN